MGLIANDKEFKLLVHHNDHILPVQKLIVGCFSAHISDAFSILTQVQLPLHHFWEVPVLPIWNFNIYDCSHSTRDLLYESTRIQQREPSRWCFTVLEYKLLWVLCMRHWQDSVNKKTRMQTGANCTTLVVFKCYLQHVLQYRVQRYGSSVIVVVVVVEVSSHLVVTLCMEYSTSCCIAYTYWYRASWRIGLTTKTVHMQQRSSLL